MKRKTIILSVAAAAITLGVAALTTTPIFANGSNGQMAPGFGYGMMGQGMMGQGMMMDQGMMGHGMMQGQGQGFGAAIDGEVNVDSVKELLESRLDQHGNDRLKVGKVEATGENTIVAEIVTVDNSLVRTIEFDTETGAHRPLN